MSHMRPSLRTASKYDTDPTMTGGTAYLMIYNAVVARERLVHGKLQDHGDFCAIGSYFQTNPNTCLPVALIDEVAAVNDSMPTVSDRERRIRVSRWLRWKLADLGMPGFHKNKIKTKK